MSTLESFHDAVSRGDFGSTKTLLVENKALINTPNEQGLYPLHQACFRGHLDLVEFLLQNGADVNACDQKQGYTALMFAAISGNLDLVEMLLRHRARIADVNKVNRTAAQMAAFVGHHHVSTLINNFLEESEIVFYTRPDISPDLALDLNAAHALYRLIISMNITPVKVLIALSGEGINGSVTRADCVLKQWRPAAKVLEDLREKYFTPHQTHEALAIKFHMLACLLRRAGKFSEQRSNEPAEANPNSQAMVFSDLIREFLSGAKPHGLPLGQEKFIRQALLSFPHPESTLWRHLVTQVSNVQPGYSPTALSLLECAINGQGPFSIPQSDGPSECCATCGDRGTKVEIKLCCNCKEVGYCSVACQRLHWFTHKKYCPILKAHHDACESSRRKAAKDALQ